MEPRKEKVLHIIGVGPGSKDLVTPMAQKIINGCDVLIGGKRNLTLLEDSRNEDKEKLVIGNNLEQIKRYIKDHIENKTIGVLVSGDPGIYSMLDYLKRNLQGITFQTLPGISALQYFCSRINMTWHDMLIRTFHGREDADVLELASAGSKVAVFTGGADGPGILCNLLIENSLGEKNLIVGENLSYPEEKITFGTALELSQRIFEKLSIVIIENRVEEESAAAISSPASVSVPGIPDERFIRGDVPMTKEEIRTISITKLRLKPKDIVYDIGAGTGSVSIECGLLCPGGRVFAFEKNEEAIGLIQENRKKFGVKNLEIVAGRVPQTLKGLPYPNAVFLGGTGGSLDKIMEILSGYPKKFRLVLNAITLETAFEALKYFEELDVENIEILHTGISKGKKTGTKHMMIAQNPVFILSGLYNPDEGRLKRSSHLLNSVEKECLSTGRIPTNSQEGRESTSPGSHPVNNEKDKGGLS